MKKNISKCKLSNIKERILSNISINNHDLIIFLDCFNLFLCKNEYLFYDNVGISKDFFKIIKLKYSELECLLDLLIKIKEKLPRNELELCIDEINRGIIDINWILEEKKMYNEIFNLYDNENILLTNDIIDNDYKLIINTTQKNYLINNFSGILWKDIDKTTVVDFLNGLDFFYLSNKAYFFILPACIRYSIENFENEQEPILEFLIFFLSDENRIKVANNNTKKLVLTYLKLMKSLNFISFFNDKEQLCLDLWLK